jgi:hypothetical protein
MVRTQIQLTEEQHRRLKRLADRLGISLSEAVRRCVDDGLARELEGTARIDRVREGRSVIGRFGSGQSDVAERHDDYLTDAFGS